MKMLPQTEYVGEIGLDFTKKTGIEKNKQIKWFEKIVEACSEKDVYKRQAQWRAEKEIKGKTPNIRDFASAEELVVLINLEDTNAD